MFTPDPSLYPFESRWFESSVGPVHYVDEGRGRPLFLLHGNPDWSFLYRKLIILLAPHYRCIAPDYPGFGLSPQPINYDHTPAAHAAILGELVDELDLHDMVVTGADWGGPIGMQVASSRPDRVGGLVMGNTFFWPQDDWKVRAFSWLMGTRLMQWLVLKRNLMVNTVLPSMLVSRLSHAEMEHYRAVAATPESRTGFAVLPVAATRERPWLTELQERVRRELYDTRLLLTVGAKDPILGAKAVVDRWVEEFPHAGVVYLPNAGHFFQEDAPDALAAAILEHYPPSDALGD